MKARWREVGEGELCSSEHIVKCQERKKGISATKFNWKMEITGKVNKKNLIIMHSSLHVFLSSV